MAVEEVVDTLPTRLHAEIGRKTITRGDAADGFAGILDGQKGGARTRRGAGAAVLLVAPALQHQRFQGDCAQGTLPMAAEPPCLLAGDRVETRAAIAVITQSRGIVGGLKGEIVVPLAAPQR